VPASSEELKSSSLEIPVMKVAELEAIAVQEGQPAVV
jgi:hypothetical protein